MKYQCVRCGKIKETKQVMLTCSGSCRVAYHRYLKAGNPPLDPIRIDDDVTPVTPTLQTPPAHEQAVFAIPEGYELVATQDLERYRAAFDMMLNEKLGALTDPQKKSEPTFTGATTFQKPIDPPTVSVTFDEEAARKRTIASTLAALDDF